MKKIDATIFGVGAVTLPWVCTAVCALSFRKSSLTFYRMNE